MMYFAFLIVVLLGWIVIHNQLGIKKYEKRTAEALEHIEEVLQGTAELHL